MLSLALSLAAVALAALAFVVAMAALIRDRSASVAFVLAPDEVPGDPGKSGAFPAVKPSGPQSEFPASAYRPTDAKPPA